MRRLTLLLGVRGSRGVRRVRAAALLVSVVTAGLVSGTAAGVVHRVAAPPITLVSGGGILGVAQDGGVLVWAPTGATKGCPPVQMRYLAGGRSGVIGVAGGSDEMCDEFGFWIAAAGSRALWGGYEPANSPWGEIVAGGLGLKPHQVGSVATEYGEAGDLMVDIVGDGPTLLYATVRVAANDSDACFPADSPRQSSCRFRVTGGVVSRVVAGKPTAVPGVPATAAVAVNGVQLADVPADRNWQTSSGVQAALNGPVEVRDARTGKLVLRVRPQGRVEQIALSDAVLAVLVHDGRQARLEVYDAKMGAMRSSVPVGLKTAKDPAAAGSLVVYFEKNTIRLLHAGQQSTTLLVTTGSAKPFDLSIDGKRIAWAENRNEGQLGLIQAINLS
jgi:hypothetical protein